MSAESLELLREVRDGLKNLSCRVESLENRTDGRGNGDHTYSTSTVNYSQSPQGASAQSASTDSVEADYQRIKSSVQSVRLPADLTLQESRQGIKSLFILNKNITFMLSYVDIWYQLHICVRQ